MSVHLHRILITCALLLLGAGALRVLLRRPGPRRAGADGGRPVADRPEPGGGARRCSGRVARTGGNCGGPVRPVPRRCRLTGPGAVRH
ncbi:hypothetical protein ABT263_09955 [Kitasatospora sp. NPDC001603]|uniref:hypothetical protein n=1 Tax=Kitasatospora sp. NPDC001603 TaxID=3154388 RepID=UPI00331FB5D5